MHNFKYHLVLVLIHECRLCILFLHTNICLHVHVIILYTEILTILNLKYICLNAIQQNDVMHMTGGGGLLLVYLLFHFVFLLFGVGGWRGQKKKFDYMTYLCLQLKKNESLGFISLKAFLQRKDKIFIYLQNDHFLLHGTKQHHIYRNTPKKKCKLKGFLIKLETEFHVSILSN